MVKLFIHLGCLSIGVYLIYFDPGLSDLFQWGVGWLSITIGLINTLWSLDELDKKLGIYPTCDRKER